jgi:NAD(P)-dependent dehydrogenase (short-subunit alcohol dehydrogenase family)
MSKFAVVTGGAGGMGLAASHVIGRDSAVLICDVSQDRLDAAQRELGAAGINCAATICDITDRESVGQLVEQAQQLGTVTSVVHTAGVSPSMGSADMILRINAVGTVLINSAFYNIASEGMALVNVASVAGHQLPAIVSPKRRYKRSLSDTERFHTELLAICNLMPPAMRPQLAYSIRTSSSGTARRLPRSSEARVRAWCQSRLAHSTLPWESSRNVPAPVPWLSWAH